MKPTRMIKKVISGGQSGADLAGLDAAQTVGIPTGGWMPLGFLTEAGPKPAYAQKYGLRDLGSPSYPARTRRNVEDAQATLIFSGTPTLQGGSLLTYKICQELKKPVLVLLLPKLDYGFFLEMAITDFIRDNTTLVLNVAGSRESSVKGTYKATYALLVEIFSTFKGWQERGLLLQD